MAIFKAHWLFIVALNQIYIFDVALSTETDLLPWMTIIEKCTWYSTFEQSWPP